MSHVHFFCLNQGNIRLSNTLHILQWSRSRLRGSESTWLRCSKMTGRKAHSTLTSSFGRTLKPVSLTGVGTDESPRPTWRRRFEGTRLWSFCHLRQHLVNIHYPLGSWKDGRESFLLLDESKWLLRWQTCERGASTTTGYGRNTIIFAINPYHLALTSSEQLHVVSTMRWTNFQFYESVFPFILLIFCVLCCCVCWLESQRQPFIRGSSFPAGVNNNSMMGYPHQSSDVVEFFEVPQ